MSLELRLFSLNKPSGDILPCSTTQVRNVCIPGNPYRSPVSLFPPHSSVSRVPQTDLTAFQVRRRTVPLSSSSTSPVWGEVGAVSSWVPSTSSVPPFSTSIPVSPSSSSAPSSTSSSAVSVTHSAVRKQAAGTSTETWTVRIREWI